MSSSLDKVLSSFVPKRILESYRRNPIPLEGPYTESIFGIILIIRIDYDPQLIEEINTCCIEKCVNICHEYGGDILMLSYNCIIVLWQSEDETESSLARKASYCSFQLKENFKETLQETPLQNFTVSFSIAGGKNIYVSYLGGLQQKWITVVSGKPILEAENGFYQSETKEKIILTAYIQNLIFQYGETKKISPNYYYLEKILQISGTVTITGTIEPPTKEQLSILWTHVPSSVRVKLYEEEKQIWGSEIRRSSLILVRVMNLDFSWDTEELFQDFVLNFQVIIQRYGGTFIHQTESDPKNGTLFIAGFGIPPSYHNDDSLRAVLVAMKTCQQMMSKMELSMAVVTGQVYCGIIGSKIRRDFALGGPILNELYQLISLSEKNMILCDQETYHLVQNYICFSQDLIQNSGRYFPISIKEDPVLLKRKLSRALVVRKTELSFLKSKVDQLKDRKSKQFVFIKGESGFGKTYLVTELRRWAQNYQEVTVAVGRGFEFEQSTLYYALGTVFSRLLFGCNALKVPCTEENKKQAIVEYLQSAYKHWFLLSALLPNDLPSKNYSKSVTGENLAYYLHFLLLQILEDCAKNQPILILIEDVQWLDSSSCHFIATLSRRKPSSILFVITGYLVPVTIEQVLKEGFEVLTLEPLNTEQVNSLVCSELEAKSIPPVVTSYLQNAKGNSFHSIQLAKKLVANGDIVIKADGECLIRPSLLMMNPKDQQFISYKKEENIREFDNLTPSQQLTLKIMSVVDHFSIKIIEAIYPSTVGRLRLNEQFSFLEQMDFIKKVPKEENDEQGDEVYIFSHKLLQESIYAMIPKSRLQQLHANVASWYESTYGQLEEKLSSYYAILATHWSKADTSKKEIRIKALEYLGKAGKQAFLKNALHESIHFFGTALNFVQKSQSLDGSGKGVWKLREAKWNRYLGTAYNLLGTSSDSKEFFFHHNRGLKLLGYPVFSVERPSTLKTLMNNFKQNFTSLFQKKDKKKTRFMTSLEKKYAIEATKIYINLAQSHLVRNEHAKGVFCINQSVLVAESIGEKNRQLAIAYSLKGVISQFYSREESIKYIDESYKIAMSLGDNHTEAFVTKAISFYHTNNGRWQEALNMTNQSLELCNRSMDIFSTRILLYLGGVICHLSAQYTQSLIFCDELEKLEQTLLVPSSWGKTLKSSTLYMMNEIEQALKFSAHAEEMKEKEEEVPFIIILAVSTKIVLYLKINDLHSAFKLLKWAVNYICQIKVILVSIAISYMFLAEALLNFFSVSDSEQREEFQTLWNKLFESFEKTTKQFLIIQVHFLIYKASFAKLNGNLQEALHFATEGMRLIKENHWNLPTQEDKLSRLIKKCTPSNEDQKVTSIGTNTF